MLLQPGILYFGSTMNVPEEEKPPVFASWAGWYWLVLAVFIFMVAMMVLVTQWMA